MWVLDTDHLSLLQREHPNVLQRRQEHSVNGYGLKALDEETARVMLAVAGREKEGWLDVEQIDNFPCEDLRTIDQLWVKYSNARFGFSVQKRIYQSLSGTREYDEKIWKTFGDRVGWRKKGEWLYYKDITFDIAAPQGHLPVVRAWTPPRRSLQLSDTWYWSSSSFE
jgi:GUN4-like